MSMSDNNLAFWRDEPGPTPIADITVGGLLADAVEREPSREAMVVSAYDDPMLSVRWTYTELNEKVNELAKALIAHGVQHGDRVALWGPNFPYWIVSELAVGRIGAVLVPLNPTYLHGEVRYGLEASGASVCLIFPGYGKIDIPAEIKRAVERLDAPPAIFTLGEQVPDVAGLADLQELAATCSDDDLAARAAAVTSDDVAQIQFTSGTTGRPKGAQLTHRNIVNNAIQTAERWQMKPEDRWCSPLPLFHTAGCGTVALGAVATACTVLPLVRFEPERVLTTIATEKCTMLETVPTILTSVMDFWRRNPQDVSSLTLVGTSGAPTPQWLGEACEKEWGAPLRVLYGSTEVSPTVTGTSREDGDDRAWVTVGRPLPWLDVRIVDPGTTNVLALDEPGEIQVRGYSVMKGYYNQPGATAAVLDDEGWFSMGDLGSFDADGYLSIRGRLKDVIIRGGENLYPAEMEDIIRDHDAVLDVAVVGVPDDFFGEEALAVMVLSEGAEFDEKEFKSWMRERATHQKVPKYVVVVDELPQTTSGKIQKFRLRDLVRQQKLKISEG